MASALAIEQPTKDRRETESLPRGSDPETCAKYPTESSFLQQPKIAMTPNAVLHTLLLPMVDTGSAPYLVFGMRLADAMERAGISGPDVAKALGVSPEMPRRYRMGLAMPRPDKMKKLAALVGMTPSELQYGTISTANAAPGLLSPQVTSVSSDELQLLECYRQLPDYARRALRARATELVENFAKASPKNPFGEGTQ
jgi:transcriptional regulator with XRE-family HTH domain